MAEPVIMRAMSLRPRALLLTLLVLACVAAGCGGGSKEVATEPVPAAPVKPDQQGASGKSAASAGKPPGTSAGDKRPAPQGEGASPPADKKAKQPRIIPAPGQTRGEARRIVEQLLQGKRKLPPGSSRVRNAGQVLRELVNGKRRRQSSSPSAKAEVPTRVIEEVLNGAR
jgi:hypothetical protein